MNVIERLKEKCRRLAESMPINSEPPTKMFAKFIVQEKILDEDAFEIAAETFKTYNHKGLRFN